MNMDEINELTFSAEVQQGGFYWSAKRDNSCKRETHGGRAEQPNKSQSSRGKKPQPL